MNQINEKKEIHLSNINIQLSDISTIDQMQNRIDEAEKKRLPKFHYFNDVEMMKWFLYERKFLHIQNERTEATITEYRRELVMFIKQLLTNGEEIDMDIDEIVDGSLFKSLQSRHLRKFQEWLATKSDHVKKN